MPITLRTTLDAMQGEADLSRILVIDDDAAVRMTIKLVLERDGHAVELASDGLAGMKAIKDGVFDLLIIDIFMPGMDGIETLREVRKHRPDLPVIMISGSSLAGPDVREPGLQAPDFLAMAVKLGAVRSLQKPFKPRDIIAAVRQCLGDAASGRAAGT
jgi:CheY-like chemotaxis protein